MPRLFAWSDLHADYPDNFQLVANLSDADFRDDTILIAGDVSSSPEKLLSCLEHLKRKFYEVSFVPGNHDLWVSSDDRENSLEKLHRLLLTCREAGVRVDAFDAVFDSWNVRIVPLVSWYLKPEEGHGSLFIPKPGEDPTLETWSDNYRIKWPNLDNETTPAEHLLSLNTPPKTNNENRWVVTFSHFLPRVELVFGDWERFQATGRGSGYDEHPEFNFTRVAGCQQLDEQLRECGSGIHIYGHQHRNRDRVIDGVRYVSHCLGYPKEWNMFDTVPSRHLPIEIRPGSTSQQADG